MPDNENLEGMLRGLKAEIPSDALAEFRERIEAIERKLSRRQPAQPSSAPVSKDPQVKPEVLGYAPDNLDADYSLIRREEISSELFSTSGEVPNPTIVDSTFDGGVPTAFNDILCCLHGGYSGKAANYITESIKRKSLERAVEIDADLAFVIFERGPPSHFSIKRVKEGTAPINYGGKVTVAFYRKKAG